jgi:large subunit ribosomal protein L17
MRHQNAGRKFDRDGSSRTAMFKNLVANLFAHERIETTVPKAKELRRIAERMITRAARLGRRGERRDRGGPEARRAAPRAQARSSSLPRWRERVVDGQLERIDVVEHLFREIAPRFIGRNGGYTRILKTRNRRGDNAELAYIELVNRDPRVGRKAVPVAAAPDAGVSVDSPVRAEAPRSRKEGEEGGEG